MRSDGLTLLLTPSAFASPIPELRLYGVRGVRPTEVSQCASADACTPVRSAGPGWNAGWWVCWRCWGLSQTPELSVFPAELTHVSGSRAPNSGWSPNYQRRNPCDLRHICHIDIFPGVPAQTLFHMIKQNNKKLSFRALTCIISKGTYSCKQGRWNPG